MTLIRSSIDSSSSTERCPKCGSREPFRYVNPEWNGFSYSDRMLACDCAEAVANREAQARRAEHERAERQRIAEERRARCPECGGDGFVDVRQDGEVRYRPCICEYGIAQNVRWADDAEIVPKRFRGARLDQVPASVRERLAGPLQDGEGFMIHGSVGTGKTYIAAALVYDLLRTVPHNRIMFATMPDVLDRIRATYNGGERDDVLQRALSVPVLVLDDLGTEKVTDWVREKVYQIINRRYNEQLTTICTTNLAPSGLARHIGERTVSRLMEMCRVVKLDGTDRRVQR